MSLLDRSAVTPVFYQPGGDTFYVSEAREAITKDIMTAEQN